MIHKDELINNKQYKTLQFYKPLLLDNTYAWHMGLTPQRDDANPARDWRFATTDTLLCDKW